MGTVKRVPTEIVSVHVYRWPKTSHPVKRIPTGILSVHVYRWPKTHWNPFRTRISMTTHRHTKTENIHSVVNKNLMKTNNLFKSASFSTGTIVKCVERVSVELSWETSPLFHVEHEPTTSAFKILIFIAGKQRVVAIWKQRKFLIGCWYKMINGHYMS